MKPNTLVLSVVIVSSCALFGAGCHSEPVAEAPVVPVVQTAPSDSIVNATSSYGADGMDVDATSTAVATSTNGETGLKDDSMATSTSNLEKTPKSMAEQPLAFPGILPEKEVTNKEVRIKTAKGDIVFELLPKEGPKAVSNFVYLAGKKFYDGLTFHRVETWVVQGGDPTGTGSGGPGYQFEDDPVHISYDKGVVAMANAGPNTNGSQFFIMTQAVPLDPSYSILGRVISGQAVADSLAVGDKMLSVTVENKK